MRRLIPAVIVVAALVLAVVLLVGRLPHGPGRVPAPPATAASAAAPDRVSTVLTSDFENGTDGWEGLGPAAVAAHAG